jgi:hypothetical protein
MAITIVKKKQQFNLNVPAPAGESTDAPEMAPAAPRFAAAMPAADGAGTSFTLYAILALVAVAVYATLLAIQWMELSY